MALLPLALVKSFWDICRLQKGPQDVPYSVYLPRLLLLVALVVDTVTLSLSAPAVDFGTVVLTVSLHLGLILGGVILLMVALGQASHVNQTVSSLLGTGLIVSLFAVAPLLMLGSVEQPSAVAVMMLMILNIWDLVITAHILRHALSVNPLIGAILAIGLFMLGIWLMDVMLPEPA